MSKINKKYDNMLMAARDVGNIRRVTKDPILKKYWKKNRKRLIK